MIEEIDKRPPYEKPQVIMPAPLAFCKGENQYSITGYEGSSIGMGGSGDSDKSNGLEIPTAPGENPVNPSPF